MHGREGSLSTQGVDAWRDLCRRLEQLGTGLLGDEYAGADGDEMLAHLADQVLCWVSWFVFHADPQRPFFHRQNDLVTHWGGPNNDNVYRHARVDPSLRYRVRGRMHSCEDFILAMRAGFMHEPVYGTLRSVTAHEIGIGPGDEFELLLGGDGSDPAWIPIPEGAVMATFREYYFDWQPEEPATMTIECLDPPEVAPPASGAELAVRFAEAAAAVEQSMTYWNRYLEDVRAARHPNSFAPSIHGAKGLTLASYAFCIFDLAPGEALVVDTDVAPARYWSLHLYNMGAFAPVDFFDRVTSLNHRQAAVDPDGRLRAVVSAEDPGVANWLDTGGRRRGLLTYRWFWPTAEGSPAPAARVVPVAEARRACGVTADAPTFDRAAVVAARRAHLTWRFRV